MLTKTFKLSLILCLAFLMTTGVTAQEDKSKRPSPPAEATLTSGDMTIAINYSSPAVKDRTVWGGLVPYGEIWRTGANEATTFEVSTDVKIEGERLPAGKYALFTIPNKDKWTIIFNSEVEQWGAYRYKETKDVLRVNVTPSESDTFNERLKFEVTENEDGALVALYWEKMKVAFQASN